MERIYKKIFALANHIYSDIGIIFCVYTLIVIELITLITMGFISTLLITKSFSQFENFIIYSPNSESFKLSDLLFTCFILLLIFLACIIIIKRSLDFIIMILFLLNAMSLVVSIYYLFSNQNSSVFYLLASNCILMCLYPMMKSYELHLKNEFALRSIKYGIHLNEDHYLNELDSLYDENKLFKYYRELSRFNSGQNLRRIKIIKKSTDEYYLKSGDVYQHVSYELLVCNTLSIHYDE